MVTRFCKFQMFNRNTRVYCRNLSPFMFIIAKLSIKFLAFQISIAFLNL
uniref:Uncharacterized protein n=1 Tax=Rhizophora mucronata TaxID=61149 RepID=A0A2P2PGX6_RHIMU